MKILPVTDRTVLNNTLKIAEEFFGTEVDPEQIPISEKSFLKLNSYNKNTVLYITDDSDNTLGWSVVVPTSKELMNDFLDKNISEKELFDKTDFSKVEALYLCSVFVLPKYRGRGYAKNLIKEAIDIFTKDKPLDLFCWIYSDEGKKLTDSLENESGLNILRRKI